MAFFVKINPSNEVVKVWDTPPPYGEEGWREAVEVRPTINDATQYYGPHSFDLTKNPVEIVWSVVDMTADEIASAAVARAAQAVKGYVDVVQARLDNFAKTRGYDSILSCATYAGSTVPKFAAEGQYAVDIRDITWATCWSVLADVQAGARVQPTPDELLALLPVPAWPA